MGKSGESKMRYTGRHTYSVDHKGRLFIPAEFRRLLRPEDEGTFVVTRGFDGSLLVYPLSIWAEFEERLRSLPYTRERVRWLLRKFVSYAERCPIDSQGRINIPAHLLEYAGIKKEALIIGLIDKIEIWNPEVYAEKEEVIEEKIEEWMEELDL